MRNLIASINQSLPASADAPEWIHLVPAGTFTGDDGRGPYDAGDAGAVIAASTQAGRKLPIDIAHAIDHTAGTGQAAPAVGWIVALEARADGIWGKVEWNERGRAAVEGREYGFISPVFTHSKAKPFKVAKILRASLTNNPNLTLKSLHEEGQDMDEELRTALGLPETADQAAILAAVTTALNASTSATAALARIAEAAGARSGATADEIVTALQARGDAAELVELRGQVRELNTRLTETVTNAAKQRAETVVDQAIQDGKVVPALRDRFIARHMKDPADVEAEIKLMPSLNAGGLGKRKVPETGDAQLTDTDAVAIKLMGIDPKAFAETAKLYRAEETA